MKKVLWKWEDFGREGRYGGRSWADRAGKACDGQVTSTLSNEYDVCIPQITPIPWGRTFKAKKPGDVKA